MMRGQVHGNDTEGNEPSSAVAEAMQGVAEAENENDSVGGGAGFRAIYARGGSSDVDGAASGRYSGKTA